MPGEPGSPKKGNKRMFSSDEEKTIGDFLISCWGKHLKVPQKVLYDTLKKHLDKFPRRTSFKDNRPGLFWRQKFFQRNSHVETAFNEYKRSGQTEVGTVPDAELDVLLESLGRAERQESDSSEAEVSPTTSAKKLKKVKPDAGESSESEDLASKVRKGVVRKRSKTSEPKKLSGTPRRGRPPLKVGGSLLRRDKSAPPGAAESKEAKTEAKKSTDVPGKGVRSSIAPDAVPLAPVRFEEGEGVEAMDCGKWYNAKIVETDKQKGEILVHFSGWGKKFDTVFPIGSTLIRGSTHKEKKQEFEKFSIGDDVLSKWTDGHFYPGTVIALNKSGSYTVMFYDGLKKLLRPPLLKRMTEMEKEEAMQTAQRVYLQSTEPLASPPKAEASSSEDSGFRRYRTSAGDRERRRSHRKGDDSSLTRRGRKRKMESEVATSKQARLDKITGSLLDKVATTLATMATTTAVTTVTASSQHRKSLPLAEESDSDSPLVIDEENEVKGKGKTSGQTSSKLKPSKDERFERFEASEILLQLSQSGGNESSDNNQTTMVQPAKKPSDKPEKQPSTKPEKQPSTKPEKQPSTKPKKQPSNKPEKKTEKEPYDGPKKQPAKQPSAKPDQENKPMITPVSDTSKPVKPVKPDAKQPVKPFKEPDTKNHPKDTTEAGSSQKNTEKLEVLKQRKTSMEIVSKISEKKVEKRRKSDELKPKSGKIFLDDSFLAETVVVKEAKKLKLKRGRSVSKEAKKAGKNLKVKTAKTSPEKGEMKDVASSSLKEKLEAGKQKFMLGKMTLTEAAEASHSSVGQLRDHLGKHGVTLAEDKAGFMLGSDEGEVVNWIHDMTDLGWGILDQQIAEKVGDFLTKELYSVVFGPDLALNRPSQKWLAEFLSRHPEIFPGRKLPLSRFRIDREGFEEWHLRWLTTLHTVDVAPNGVFYLDEVVWDTNPKLMHNVTFTHPEGGVLSGLGARSKITTLTCIGANGIPLNPFHVFPQGGPTLNEPLLMTSQSGTMDSEVLLQWFRNVFLAEVGGRRPLALLVDSHLVQVDFRTLKLAEENHVVIYNFLPAGAHFLQHPDQKLFGRLRMQWKKSIIRQFLKNNSSKQVTTSMFAQNFSQEFKKVATSSNIKTCFALTKLYDPVAEPVKEKKNKRKMLKPVAYIEDKQEKQEERKKASKEDGETSSTKSNKLELSVSPEKNESVSPEKIESVSPEKIESVSPEKIESVSPEKIESVSPEKIESVSPEKIGSVSPEKIESVSPEKIGSVSPEKIESVSPEKIKSVSPEKIESVSPEKMESVSPEKIESVSPEKIESVSPEKIESVSPEKNESVSPEKMESVSPEKIESVSPEKIESVSPEESEIDSQSTSTSVSPSTSTSASPSKKSSVSPKYRKSYKRGETVLAKWSDCRLYSATILKKLGADVYRVKYYDGLVKVLKDDFLRPWGSVPLLPQKPEVMTPPKVTSPRRRSLEVKARSRRISELSEERNRRLSENLESASEKNKPKKIKPSPLKPLKPPVVYELGEQVLCKWTDRKFYPATILKKIAEDTYKVKYYDKRKKVVQSSWLQPWKPGFQTIDKIRTSIEQPISVKVELGNPAQKSSGNPAISVSVKSVTVVEKDNKATYSQAGIGGSQEKGGESPEEGKAPEGGKGFKKGDRVLARWTDCKPYPATILKCLEDDQFTVQYYDGMTRTLKGEMVKPWESPPAPQVKKEGRKSVSAEVPASKETPSKSIGGKPCFSGLPNNEFYQNKTEPNLNKFKCNFEGCGKVFRKEIVLQQHHKHCHQQPIRALETSPAHKKKPAEKTSVKRKLSTDSTPGNPRPKEGNPRSKGGKPPLDVYRRHADPSAGGQEVTETSPETNTKKKRKKVSDEKNKSSERTIRCVCRTNHDDAELIRCLSCNYWQHCRCEGVPHDEDNADYVCRRCSAPPAGRKSGIYLFNNDFLKTGKLPILSHKDLASEERSWEEGIVEVREERKKAKEMQSLMMTSNRLISDLVKIKDALHAVKKKIRIVPADNLQILGTFKETNLNVENGGNLEENGGNLGGNGENSEENGGSLGENGGNLGGNGENSEENGGSLGENGGNLGGNGGNSEENGGSLGENGGNLGENDGNSKENGGNLPEDGKMATENGGDENSEKENVGNDGCEKMEVVENHPDGKSESGKATPSGGSGDNSPAASGSLWVPITIKKTYTPVVTSSQATNDVTKDEELLRCRSNLLTHIHDVQNCLSDRLKMLEECVTATEKAYERCTGESPDFGEFAQVRNDCDVIHDLIVAARDQ